MSRFDEAVEASWARFEERLVKRLSSVGDRVVRITVPAETEGDGASPYLQFTGADGGVKGEVASNTFLDQACRLFPVQEASLEALGWRRPDERHPNWWYDVDADHVAALGSMAVGALRHALQVVGPQFLTTRGLYPVTPRKAASYKRRARPAAERPAQRPRTFAERVAAILEAAPVDVTLDADGDFETLSGCAPIWVTPVEERRVLRLFGNVAVKVTKPDQARVELDILNRAFPAVKFVLVEATVVMHREIPASPLFRRNLLEPLMEMHKVMDVVAADTALRVGGRTVMDDMEWKG